MTRQHPRKIKLNARRVEQLAAEGLSQAQIAHMLGVSPDTLTARKQDSPVIAAALNKGRVKIVHELVNLLVEQARAGNVAANIFALKNLAGWKDRVELTEGDGTPQPLIIALPGYVPEQPKDITPVEDVEVVDEPLEHERPTLKSSAQISNGSLQIPDNSGEQSA
jgi:hypothetical protein